MIIIKFTEFDDEEDNWRPPQKKWWKITKRVLGYSVIALMVFLIGVISIRSIASKPPSSMTELVWTKEAINAYREAKQSGKQFSVLSVSSSQSFDQGDGDDDKSDDTASPMVSIYSTYYFPETDQIQFSVRFNNRLFNYLFEAHPEAKQLYESEKELYTFTLRFEHNEKEYSITDYTFTADEKGGYTYRKLFFDIADGIDLSSISLMTLEIAYVGEPANVRHLLYIYKTGFGLLEYDYGTPTSADTTVISRPNHAPIFIIIGIISLLVLVIFKATLAVPMVIASVNALIAMIFSTDMLALALVFLITYTTALVPILIFSIIDKNN